jgi:hypothetical protein
VLRHRRLDFVGGAQQKIWPLDVLVHLNERAFYSRFGLVFFVGFGYPITDDFIANFYWHVCIPVSVLGSVLTVRYNNIAHV